MPRKRQSRTYLKRRRFYGDFRDYADVGGGKEALTPSGHKYATQDPAVAAELVQARIEELERLRRHGVQFAKHGVADGQIRDLTRLGDFVDHHLRRKAVLSNVTDQWMEADERHLDAAIEYFGATAKMREIETNMVTDFWEDYLMKIPKWASRAGSKGSPDTIGPGTQRKYLNSLSNMFRRAIAEGYVPRGHNPVAYMFDKPNHEDEEAEWLEVPEAALLLHAAKLYQPKREDLALPCVYPLVAMLLLTGGRLAEVLGLETRDVMLDRKVIIFRPRKDRRLKTRGSHRPVPLWPQLEAILREYLAGPHAPRGRLLFPSPGSSGKRIKDIRKVLDELSVRIGRADEPIRSKMFRHTYCAARLQTLDRGHPIHQYTVERELGHSSGRMVTQIYGHLGQHRHRSECVEYRVEQFACDWGDQIAEVEHRSAGRNSRERRDLRVDPAIEALVLVVSGEMPEKGPIPVAAEVCKRGGTISSSGVGWIWRRHGLSRKEYRLEAVESGRLRALEEALRS